MTFASSRDPLRFLLVFWVFVIVPAGAQDPPPVSPPALPNFVLCMADDLGWGDVGFNGNEVIRTPHLDGLAKAGMRFTRFYAGAPVCSPTRGSFVTGRHPYRYGIFGANTGHLPSREVTVAELCRAKGYATGHFGKWHLGTLTKTERDSNRGGARGAAHYAPPWEHGYEVCLATEAKVPTFDPLWMPRGARAGGPWWDPVKRADSVPYGTAYWNEKGEKVGGLSGDDSRIVMDRALAFIEKAHEHRRPFLATIWFHAPHLPVVAGPRHTAPYEKHPPYLRHYYGCIGALDEQMGRLRSRIEALGQTQDTLIFFCSDNGPEGRPNEAPGSTGPLRGRKRSLLEGGIRVPGFLVWPGRVPSGVTSVPAVTSDLLPTVAAALGAKPAAPADGLDLLPVLNGAIKKRGRPIAFESRGQLALIDDRYKIIHRPQHGRTQPGVPFPDAAAFSLYDLKQDPGETRDLASTHPEITKKMIAALRTWRASCMEDRAR